MNFSSHEQSAPVSLLPATYYSREKCDRIRNLLCTVTPGHFSPNKHEELKGILQRLGDMTDFGDTPNIFVETPEERVEYLKLEDLYEFLNSHPSFDKLTPLVNCPEGDSSWFRIVNVGYPLLTNGTPLLKIGINTDIYITEDNISVMAEIMFLPCISTKMSFVEFHNSQRYIEVPDTQNGGIRHIDLRWRDAWQMVQHIDGSWFSAIEPAAPEILSGETEGRARDMKSCIFTTNSIPSYQWRIIDIDL